MGSSWGKIRIDNGVRMLTYAVTFLSEMGKVAKCSSCAQLSDFVLIRKTFVCSFSQCSTG